MEAKRIFKPTFFSIVFFFSCLMLFVSFSGSISAAGSEEQAKDAFNDLQVPFVQTDSTYRATLSDGFVHTEDGQLRYMLQGTEDSWEIVERFLSNNEVNPQSGMEAPTTVSRFMGDDPDNWERNLKTYRSIMYPQAFSGIDVKVEAKRGTVEKIYTVEPGAAPSRINMQLRGVASLRVHSNGDLVLKNNGRKVRMTAPVAYQIIDGERRPVDVHYDVRADDKYGFNVGAYNTDHPLIIDPLLDATYFGGGGADVGSSVVVAPDDSIYVGGHTTSSALATSGSYDETQNNQDFFIAKFSSDLSTLEAATYIGGSSTEREAGIALAGNGEVVIAGRTTSSDFPTHASTPDSTKAGDYDLAIARLSGDLSTFVGGSYYGGGATDYFEDIAVDSNGNAYVVGWGFSNDVTTTSGAYDETPGSGIDAYIAKFDGTIDNLSASSYLGYDSSDYAWGVVIDSSDDVYILGRTISSNFPTTAGAYDQTYNNRDGYIAKLSNDLTSLQASTFLSGSDIDEVERGVIADNGDLYVSLEVESGNFPTTPGAYQTSKSGGEDMGIARLSADLSTLKASTFFGGSSNELSDFGIASDSDNNIYVFGETRSSNLPTASADDNTLDGTSDMFFSVLNADLDNLIESTYIGGASDERTNNMTMDNNGDLLLVGQTFSNDFPTTSGVYQETYGGSGDFAIVRMKGQVSTSGSSGSSGGGSNFGQMIDVSVNILETFTCSNPMTTEVTVSSDNGTQYRMTDSIHYADFGEWKPLEGGNVTTTYTFQGEHTPGTEKKLYVEVRSQTGAKKVVEQTIVLEGLQCATQPEPDASETGEQNDGTKDQDDGSDTITDDTASFGKPVLPDNVDVYDLVKTESDPAVYYIGNDHKRHAFPNKHVFDSWGFDFDDVNVVPDHTVAFLTLGANMVYKPGVRPVTFRSTNDVYAVDNHGLLRHIAGPSVARTLYGEDWKDKVHDISVVFFNNYVILDDKINSGSDFDPSKLTDKVDHPSFIERVKIRKKDE